MNKTNKIHIGVNLRFSTWGKDGIRFKVLITITITQHLTITVLDTIRHCLSSQNGNLLFNQSIQNWPCSKLLTELPRLQNIWEWHYTTECTRASSWFKKMNLSRPFQNG